MKIKNIAGLLILVISITFGCNQESPKETINTNSTPAPKKENVQTPVIKDTPPTSTVVPSAGANASGEPDTYGRLPGDEHYGHSHAPKVDEPGNQTVAPQFGPISTPATPPTSGPDAYGRNPGDEHYGHDHD